NCLGNEPMMKTCARIIGCVALLAVSVDVFGQSNSLLSCENDERPGVRAFCKDLKDFQNAVNAGTATTVDNSSGPLNKLDMSHAAATDKFITATAPLIAAKAALSSVASKAVASGALQDAGQTRLDRQLGPTSDASGTTTLVSKAGSAELLSLALDTGVLTQSVNGATATLSTN